MHPPPRTVLTQNRTPPSQIATPKPQVWPSCKYRRTVLKNISSWPCAVVCLAFLINFAKPPKVRKPKVIVAKRKTGDFLSCKKSRSTLAGFLSCCLSAHFRHHRLHFFLIPHHFHLCSHFLQRGHKPRTALFVVSRIPFQ